MDSRNKSEKDRGALFFVGVVGCRPLENCLLNVGVLIRPTTSKPRLSRTCSENPRFNKPQIIKDKLMRCRCNGQNFSVR